ncbi:hypothetical protein BD408DRAFT_432794 [Parasitella parasitica]|nr:hypothetical protein BD408DRAFT_432794 [Parasitella parasitica]
MSVRFFKEDGQGGMFNEDGSEAMDWEEEADNPLRTQTLTSLHEWRLHQMIIEPAAHDLQRVDVVMTELEAKISSSRKVYNNYSDEQKALFLYLLKFRFLKAKPAAERALINVRTAQVNRAGSQLQVEHKHFLMNLFDEEPQATRQDVADALTAAFEGFSLKASQVGTFIKDDCNLTVKRITRRPAARNSPESLLRRKEWVEKWSQTDHVSQQLCINYV